MTPAQQPNPMDEFMIKRYELSALVGMTDGDLDYINVLDCTIGDLVHAISTRPNHPASARRSVSEMSDKDKFICKECDMNCELKATTHFEDDWPKICPFGVLLTGGYVHEPKWLRRKRT